MQPQSSASAAQPRYGWIFLILAVSTVVEVGVSYFTGGVRLPLLIGLAAVKACLVLLYFMHLRFDRRVFAVLFTIGLILVIPLVLVLTLATPHAR
jgi:cytochrome c oxidase subunit 4